MNERLPDDYCLKEEYDFNCCVCEKRLYFHTSILMEMGINCGHCTCPKCKTFLKLSIDLKTDSGKSVPYEQYLANRKRLE
jgi:hypothetical protein